MFEGYRYRFLKNVSSKPSLNHFSGINNPEIPTLIADEQFDAVVLNAWNYKSAWQAMRACWQTGTLVMVRSDSHLHTQRSLMKRAGKSPLYRWFIPKLDACLPVGQWSRDYFFHYGAKPERTYILPHVVDDQFFRSESAKLVPQRKILRSRWGISDEAIVFLFVGKFVEKKRPLDFVAAVGEAAQEGAEVAGLMVGDGLLRASCEELVSANDFPISFAGFLNQSEITQAYVAADILVLPSDGGETWGLVVNEAMACGLPCFVSDKVGSGPDMIVAGETGYVFPLGDISRLKGLIKTVATSSALLDRMRRGARSKAGDYSVSVGVERMLCVLREVKDRARN